MTDKQKNLIVRTITGVLFVGCMVSCFLQPKAMVFLFALITGLSIWEFCGLVNEEAEDVSVNRFISTVAGVYFFLAVAGFRTGITGYNLHPHHRISLHLRVIHGQQECHQRLGLHDALTDVHRPPLLAHQRLGFRGFGSGWSGTLRYALAFERVHLPLDQ